MEIIKWILSLFEFQKTVVVIKDLFNILFFGIVSTVTILTYIKAKKTILQPVKTEIFKEQLKLFSSIMEIFNGKTELELRQFFGFEKLTVANIVCLIDNYAELFFDIEYDIEKRPYNKKLCPYARVSKQYAEKYFSVIDEAVKDENNEEQTKPEHETKAAIWKNYEYGMVKIPKEFEEARTRLDKLMKSPLLPKDCVKYLEEIIKRVNENVTNLEYLLTEISQELPEKYPNREILHKASIIWIQNMYNERFLSLEECAEKLTDYLRSYLGVDTLMDES